MRRWLDAHPWTERIGFAVLVAVAYFAIRAYQQRGAASGEAPALAGATLTGSHVSLADLRGAPVLVHFWATWCGVCRMEEGNVDAVARDHRVLTVASQSGSTADVRAYVGDHGLAMPVLLDPDGSLAARWGVRAFPTTFVLDAAGAVRHVEVGYTTELGLRARIGLAGI